MLADIGPEVGADLNDRKKWMKQLEADWSRGDPLGEAAFEGAVDHWLRSHRGMVIGEVVPIVSHGIETGDIPGGLFDEVIVDEFQDLTKAEQDLIQRIWAGPDTGSLVVLGDDDQSIYAFRHAHPEGIRGWHERFGTAEFHDIAIPENRRSLPDIVVLANSMMQTLGATKDPMVPVRAGDAHVAKIYWDTLNEEIEGIARAIVAISQSGRAIHVLVTRRFVGHELRRLLEDQGVAAMTSFHEELLQMVAVRRAFTLLSMIAGSHEPIRVACMAILPSSARPYPFQSELRAVSGFGRRPACRYRVVAEARLGRYLRLWHGQHPAETSGRDRSRAPR